MASIDLPFEFNRIFKGPATADEVFTSTTDLNNYLTSPVRYAGMIVSLVEGGVVTCYKLNATEDAWEEVGSGGGTGAGSFDTGVLSGCVMSINGGNAALLDVTAGTAIIADAATEVITDVTFAGVVGATVPDLATQGETYVSIDGTGALLFEAAEPNETLRRTQIFLGKLVHEGNTVIEVVSNQQEIAYGAANGIADFFRAYNLVNLQGNTFSGSGLDVVYSGGKIFSVGSNYAIDPKNPHVRTFAGASPLSFRYRAIDGSQGAVVTAIDPTVYESAPNVYTVIGGSLNRATNIRFYLFPSGVIRVMAGQQFYTNIAEAIRNLPIEAHTIEANIADNASLVAVLVVRQGATDLNLTSDAVFLYPNAFGQISLGASGYSVSSLQNAYNNSESPEMVVDAARGAVTIKDNATPIAANLLEVTDNADLELFGVDVTETKVKQLGFVDNATAKINTTTAENISITDSVETSLYRKESDVLYIEDFKENLPSAILTASNVAITINDVADATYLSNTIATFTQASALAGYHVETAPIVITNSNKWLLEPIKIQAMQGISGGAGTWDFRVFTSTDGVSYADKKIAVQLGNLKNDKIKTQLADDTTHVKLRWTIVNPDNATTLTLGGFTITSDAFPIGQTTITDSARLHTGNGFGSVNTLIRRYANIAFSENGTYTYSTVAASQISPRGLFKINDSATNAQDVEILKDGKYTFSFQDQGTVAVSFGLSLNSSQLTTGISTITLANRLDYITADGSNGIDFNGSSWSGNLKRGDKVRVHFGSQAGAVGASTHALLTIEGTAYADNVIVDAATFNNDTMIRLTGTNGYGATNTKIRRFGTLESSIGTAVTYTDSATDGASFLINETGTYSLTYEGNLTGANWQIGFSKNSTQLTTNIANINVLHRLAMVNNTATSESAVVSWTGLLNEGDIIRPHGDGSAVSVDERNNFTISKIATPPAFVQLDVSNERENRYTINWNAAGVKTGGNHNGITVTKISTGIYEVDYTVLGLISIPSFSAISNGNSSISLDSAFAVTASKARFQVTIGTGTATSDSIANLTISLNDADYKKPKAFIANAVSITNHVTGGTEYETSETVDGKKVYARTYSLIGSYSATFTIDTIPSITPIALIPSVENNVGVRYFSENNGQYYFDYTSGTGVFRFVRLAGTHNKISVTVKYLKP